MRGFCPRVATFTILILAASEGRACPNELGPKSVSDEAADARILPQSSMTCQMPACYPDECTTASTPFTRLDEGIYDPLNFSINCFAVAKRVINSVNKYLLYDYISLAGTFRRYSSTNGLDWDAGVVATGLSSLPWTQVIQCPDPHFTGDQTMYMYYNAKPSTQDPPALWRVAYATSADQGVTWTTHSTPIVMPGATRFPYMPSAVEYQGKILLAFNWMQDGGNGSGPVKVLQLDDPTDTTPTTLNADAIPEGEAGAWDDGATNRPRLVVDLDGVKIHMFYSGHPWDGTKPARQCAGIGHAVSCDGGVTWVKTVTPVMQRRPNDWDAQHALKSSLVWESSPRRLRLYFEAGGSGQSGLGIAEAPWSSSFMAVCPQGQTLLLADEDAGSAVRNEAGEPPARITLSPNPTRGEILVGVELAPAHRIGTASLTVYDITGRVVREVWSGAAEIIPANTAWDGRDSGGARVADGRYLVRLRVGEEAAAADWVTMIR